MQLTQQQKEMVAQRVEQIGIAFHSDVDSYLYGGVEANDFLTYQTMDADSGYASFTPWRLEAIHRVIMRLLGEGRFALNQNYVQAFRATFANEAAAQKSGVGANERMIIEELIKRNIWGDDLTSEAISQVLTALWSSLADNQQYTQEAQATNLRNARIAEMTQNGTRGFSIAHVDPMRVSQKIAYDADGRLHDPNRGMIQGFSRAVSGPWSPGESKSFAEMSNEEVAQLHSRWKASNDLKNLPVEELRKVASGRTDVFGKTLHLPKVLVPEDQAALINPATGVEFKQRELIHYINQSGLNGRNLISRDGRVRPGTEQYKARLKRFEDIIKGLRG